MCGRQAEVNGPSPRTWGELLCQYLVDYIGRTIPTHVGRTKSFQCRWYSYTDHPHARGENNRMARTAPAPCGPSPRTWGELGGVGAVAAAGRTIPTHVGRTKYRQNQACQYPDHPHARGENQGSGLVDSDLGGPSPRTWGERIPAYAAATLLRTIPTHVGRTSAQIASMVAGPDHPHARGENAEVKDDRRLPAGPSPRTWGEQISRAKPCAVRRTIPTHVGRTCSPPAHDHNCPDHPHARGENSPE